MDFRTFFKRNNFWGGWGSTIFGVQQIIGKKVLGQKFMVFKNVGGQIVGVCGKRKRGHPLAYAIFIFINFYSDVYKYINSKNYI